MPKNKNGKVCNRTSQTRREERGSLDLVDGRILHDVVPAALEVDGAVAAHAVKLAELAPALRGARAQHHFAVSVPLEEEVVQEDGGGDHDQFLVNGALALECHLVLVRVREHGVCRPLALLLDVADGSFAVRTVDVKGGAAAATPDAAAGPSDHA